MRIEHELPSDQTKDDDISVCFDTVHLDEDIEILGAPKLEVEFSTDRPHAYLIARICEVSPEGISERISFRPFNLAHYVSHEYPENLVPGKVYKAIFDLSSVFPHIILYFRLNVGNVLVNTMVQIAPQAKIFVVYSLCKPKFPYQKSIF